MRQTNLTVANLLRALKTSHSLSVPCIGLPRLLFGAKEDIDRDPETRQKGLGLFEAGFSEKDFISFRWRWHAAKGDKMNKAGKALVDLSRVFDDMLREDNVNAHRPIKQLCTSDTMWVRIDESPLVLHHYVGTYEQWMIRDDPRKKRTEDLYSDLTAVNHTEDTRQRSWLGDFTKSVGLENATVLLKDVGKVDISLTSKHATAEAKLKLLMKTLYGKKMN